MNIATPGKKSPPLSQQPPLKVEVLLSPTCFKKQEKEWGIHTMKSKGT